MRPPPPSPSWLAQTPSLLGSPHIPLSPRSPLTLALRRSTCRRLSSMSPSSPISPRLNALIALLIGRAGRRLSQAARSFALVPSGSLILASLRRSAVALLSRFLYSLSSLLLRFHSEARLTWFSYPSSVLLAGIPRNLARYFSRCLAQFLRAFARCFSIYSGPSFFFSRQAL